MSKLFSTKNILNCAAGLSLLQGISSVNYYLYLNKLIREIDNNENIKEEIEIAS